MWKAMAFVFLCLVYSLNVLSSRLIRVASTNKVSPFQKSESDPLCIHGMFSFRYLFIHWWMLG